jgi:hypothetical protein
MLGNMVFRSMLNVLLISLAGYTYVTCVLPWLFSMMHCFLGKILVHWHPPSCLLDYSGPLTPAYSLFWLPYSCPSFSKIAI